MSRFNALLMIIVMLSISNYFDYSSSITPVEEGARVITKSNEEFSTILTNNPEIIESYHDFSYTHLLEDLLGGNAIVERSCLLSNRQRNLS